VNDFIASQAGNAAAAEFIEPLVTAMADLDGLTQWVIEQAQSNPNEVGAASVEYLHVFGYVAYSYMWARMAVVALEGEGEFYQAKLATARFYNQRVLPRYLGLAGAVRGGAESLFEMDADWFQTA
jgi:hypothetical protein